MNIRIIAVGKTKEKHWRLAEVEYTQRIQRYAALEQIVVKESSLESLKNPELVKRNEMTAIEAKLDSTDCVIALDGQGRQFSSEELAEFLEQKMLQGQNRLVFVIGGPLGLHSELLAKADVRLSLSKMTLPHELAKVVLLEQIYRAFTIRRGEKYHK